MTRRALVTGAQGFVGRILCAYLEEHEWDVLGADLVTPAEDPSRFVCDVSEADQVRRMLEWAGEISHVFHLAALAFVPAASRDPEKAFRANLLGTVYLTNALRDQAPRARLIYIGSADCYGKPTALPVTEEHPLRPNNPYSISKTAADHYCAYMSHELDIVRMRPFNHSGPGQSPDYVLPSLARQVVQVEKGALDKVRVGNLKAARDFLHVRDVVRAYERAALDGKRGEVYNVCSGQATPVQEALADLRALANVLVPVEVDPALLRPVDVERIVGSYDRLRAHTGWQPETPLVTLLSDLLDYWRERV